MFWGAFVFYGALTPLELEYCTRLFNDLLTDGSAKAVFFFGKTYCALDVAISPRVPRTGEGIEQIPIV